MEEKICRLFDCQRFSGSARLSAIISDVESRYAGALSDDDLELVSAAGDSSEHEVKSWSLNSELNHPQSIMPVSSPPLERMKP